jgi:hypothetical protein
VLLLAACVAPPTLGTQATALQSLQRPLQPDFTPAALTAHAQHAGEVVERLLAEPARLAHATDTPKQLLDQEAQRTSALPRRAATLWDAGLGRAGDLPASAGRVLTPLVEPGGSAARRQDAALLALGLRQRPLGEIDDRRHRTDPQDDRPEADLLQRLVRRLRL